VQHDLRERFKTIDRSDPDLRMETTRTPVRAPWLTEGARDSAGQRHAETGHNGSQLSEIALRLLDERYR
jgi:hypothetical protein